MVTRLEGILWAVLERCSSSVGGYEIETSEPFIEILVDIGLVVVREDGRAETTEKGRRLLDRLNDQIRNRKRDARAVKKAAKSARRKLH